MSAMELPRSPEWRRDAVNHVLFTTGALNPPHFGHVRMMQMARDALRAQGLHVVAAYLSPSPDAYLAYKLQVAQAPLLLPAKTRVALCRAAIAEAGVDDWLFADDWESRMSSTAPFSYVLERREAWLQARVPDYRVRFMYVAGEDLLHRCWPPSSFFRERGVIIRRPTPWSTRDVQSSCHTYINEPTHDVPISSTRMRLALLGAGGTREEWMPQCVHDHLLQMKRDGGEHAADATKPDQVSFTTATGMPRSSASAETPSLKPVADRPKQRDGCVVS